MDKLATYRTLIKKLLIEYRELMNRSAVPKEVETDIVFDEEHDHYLLVNIGWAGRKRFRGTTVYLRLRNGKIWVEEAWLEDGIVKDLLAAGVPKEDIVLAFQHPEMRPFTEFAVAKGKILNSGHYLPRDKTESILVKVIHPKSVYIRLHTTHHGEHPCLFSCSAPTCRLPVA